MPVFDVHGQWGAQPCSRGGDELASFTALLVKYELEPCCVVSAEAVRANFIEGNRKLAEALSGQTRMLGYVVINGHYVEASMEEQRKYLGKSQFVGLYFDGVHTHHAIDSAEMDEVLNAARRYGKPIWVRTECRAQVDQLLTAARAFKSLNFIMGGMGGGDWPYALVAAEQQLNVFLDSGGAPYDRDKLRAAMERGFERRVVFGSGAGRAHPAAALGMVKDADLRPAQKERLLSANAKELFGL